ncbi:hypothetical protein EV697_10422 [Bisgaardia hudsonensis]|uniref:DUF535 domain-containing protein n=1 Tax=Bisgaardia hudsonensis TaxID=109472 RepID=A0A4R2MXA8_9PAST|nr:DUF535 family protein [Bisgaardia hudsonensis]QLB12179.1 hypothetical protein A6A11_00395 [Bisgaardia hudsonensis]TCP12217.1 hypothetical protein EV697_10422 [Bisgaardia hudsonensis]
MSKNIYQWPNPLLVYPDRENKSYRLKRFRFKLRMLLNYFNIQKFEKFINQHDYLIDLLNNHPMYSYPVAHRFLDKRFHGTQKLNIICENLTFLPKKFKELKLAQLWEKSVNFGEVIENFELILKINEYQPMEGYWSLELVHKPSQELIYLLTFGKVEDSLLIGVIQGPNCEGSKEIVKALTKQCHGLRPAYLMIEIMKALTMVLGYEKLFGIPQKYQNKSRFVRSSRYLVNYDTLFSESGGKLEKYWDLPLDIGQKTLDGIPSKKRSMYKKRYAMLDEIMEILKSHLLANK